jgi:hypothetical protein
VVTYDRNSLTHPLWVCGFSWNKISTHFMELRNYYEILLRKILHFVRGTGILAEWSTWEHKVDDKMVPVQGLPYATTPRVLILAWPPCLYR